MSSFSGTNSKASSTKFVDQIYSGISAGDQQYQCPVAGALSDTGYLQVSDIDLLFRNTKGIETTAVQMNLMYI